MTPKPFPTTLQEFQQELPIHAQVGRSDPGFRLNIVLSQIGTLAAHFTHDAVENPTARPFGSKNSEINDFGHALLQLMTYGCLREIDLQEAANMALSAIRDNDFVKRESTNNDKIIGTVACSSKSEFEGTAYVVESVDDITPPIIYDLRKIILVIPHAIVDSRLARFGAIVTDHGGIACHAAIIARENEIPCIVGTGNATEKITSGERLKLNLIDGSVEKVF